MPDRRPRTLDVVTPAAWLARASRRRPHDRRQHAPQRMAARSRWRMAGESTRPGFLDDGRGRRSRRFSGTFDRIAAKWRMRRRRGRGQTQVRRLWIMGLLLLAGCAAPATVAPISASRQAVTAIELEYVSKFLMPATAYDLLPPCPRPANAACSDPAIVATLSDRQKKLHNTITALRSFSDASPQADASALIDEARRQLSAGEALIPAKALTP